MSRETRITTWLSGHRGFWLPVFGTTTAFCTYTCMYAFRRPFTVGTFEGLTAFGMDYKAVAIIAQVVGYALSKFVGIKVIAEMTAGRRAVAILTLIGLAELALLGFAIVPAPWNVLFLLLNGLPLGMIWGLVFAYLEGRQTTEMMGAGLSVTFIVSSGFVKSVGQLVMLEWGLSEFWMPVVTGALFAVPLICFVWLLDQVPLPSATDEALRSRREPMDAPARLGFARRFAFSIAILTAIYVLLTVYRDLRDNFAADIWLALGYGDTPVVFTASEIPISVAVLGVMGSLMWIRGNRAALLVNLYIILAGALLVGVATAGFQAGLVGPLLWMILVGLGLFMGYVPFNCILFERFVAYVGTAANVGFLMYVVDAFGYLSSAGVLVAKSFFLPETSWFDFFVRSSYVVSISVALLASIAVFHFSRLRVTNGHRLAESGTASMAYRDAN